jgi:hypothetical protein
MLDLAERPVWRSPTGCKGSPGGRPLFRFIAGKRSMKFRFPKAASRGVLNKSLWPLVSWDFGFILNNNLQEINI